jgi:hypothetical protein
MTIPSNVVAWAQQAQQQTGVSDLAAALALSTVGPESSFDPNAVGDNGSSFGLTQLHWGGLGSGYSQAQLTDPVQNLSIAMLNIQASLNATGGDTSAALQPWSTRSADLAGLAEAQSALGTAPAGGLSLPFVGAGLSPVLLLAVAIGAVIVLSE